MGKRTTIVLEQAHEKAVKRIMHEDQCSKNKAVGALLDKGLEAEYLRRLLEQINLKIFYYLRQIAKERGVDFVDSIEKGFAESKEGMIKALMEEYSYVGK